MKDWVLVIAVLLLCRSGLAQSGWVRQHPLPRQHALNAVTFVDAMTGWAVGDSGAILRTSDGGAYWTTGHWTQQGLRDVSFVDAKTGWVVGLNATILHTTDGGVTWASQSLGLEEGAMASLHNVFFFDATTGCVTGIAAPPDYGHIIAHTTNGGLTWTPHLFADEMFSDIYFVDASRGWAITSTDIRQTTDGGTTWVYQYSMSEPAWGLHSIHFIDANVGWVAGRDGLLLHTTDGGETWCEQNSGTTFCCEGFHFVDENTGWMVGSTFFDGEVVITHTTDGGAHWTSIPREFPSDLRGVFFLDAGRGWAVGSAGTILSTSDGGTTWLPRSDVMLSDLYGVSFVDSHTGLAVGAWGTILRTSNGGGTWTAQPSGTEVVLRDVVLLDESTGIAVGDGGTVLRTTDGGTSWTAQVTGIVESLYAVSFATPATGAAVGSFGAILWTTDGGATWVDRSGWTGKQPGWTGETLYGVDLLDDRTAWAVGSGGVILQTTDRGNTWTPQLSGMTVPLWDVSFVDANSGWVVGGHSQRQLSNPGRVLHTTDGGSTWEFPWGRGGQGVVAFLPEACCVSGANHAWAAGWFSTGAAACASLTDGYLYTTSVWSPWEDDLPEYQGFHDVCFTDPMTGTVVGTHGLIFRTTTGGATDVDPGQKSALPHKFVLHQNYPNPFNPITTIGYAVPHAGQVTLKVFSVLGAEVATLADGEQVAGSFTATWNASGMPSGVYYYRLAAGNDVQTRKMMLMK